MCGTCPDCAATCPIAVAPAPAVVGEEFPFEIHVTVHTPEHLSPFAFTNACTVAMVKGIEIINYGPTGEWRSTHLMTSHKLRGTLKQAQQKMQAISETMTELGLEVEREKIETVPWHPGADNRGPGQYLEIHAPLICKNEDAQRVREIALTLGFGLSRNMAKTVTIGYTHYLVTARSTDAVTAEQFREHFSQNLNPFVLLGADVGTPVAEFAIEDSNRALDAGWLEAE